MNDKFGIIIQNKKYGPIVFACCPECGVTRLTRISRANQRCNACRLKHLQTDKGHNWQGGKILRGGYYWVYFPSHHRASANHYVKRAVIVLEEKLGRFLLDNEDSHHKNEITTDDSPDNLEALAKPIHSIHHNIQNKKAQWMEKFRWPSIEEWDGIELKDGVLLRGFKLGKKLNKINIYKICSKCGKGRWLIRYQVKEPYICNICTAKFTLLKINAKGNN